MADIEMTANTTGDDPGGPEEAESGVNDKSKSTETPKDLDEIYDAAFEEFLGPAKQGSKPATEDADDDQPKGETDADTSPRLTPEQSQLLSRLHMTPEMIAGWSDKQRDDFLANAAKRESDQTSAYKTLKAQLEGVSKQVHGENPDGEQSKPNAESAGQPPVGFSAEAAKVAERLVDDYGEEIGPAGQLLVNLAAKLDEVIARNADQNTRLAEADATSDIRNRLLVEMSIDSGIRDLVSDFPSLAKPKVRSLVEERFVREWQNADNPHREGSGPILERVRSALRDAAKAELGTNTETAAQVALANRTKERLKGQPPSPQGKGRAPKVTEDDIYDEAFEQTIGSELNR